MSEASLRRSMTFAPQRAYCRSREAADLRSNDSGRGAVARGPNRSSGAGRELSLAARCTVEFFFFFFFCVTSGSLSVSRLDFLKRRIAGCCADTIAIASNSEGFDSIASRAPSHPRPAGSVIYARLPSSPPFASSFSTRSVVCWNGSTENA